MITTIILTILIGLGLGALIIFFVVIGMINKTENKMRNASELLRYRNKVIGANLSKVYLFLNSIETNKLNFYDLSNDNKVEYILLKKYLEKNTSRIFCEYVLYDLNHNFYDIKKRRLKRELEKLYPNQLNTTLNKRAHMVIKKRITKQNSTVKTIDSGIDEMLLKYTQNTKFSGKANYSAQSVASFIKLYFILVNDNNSGYFLPIKTDD